MALPVLPMVNVAVVDGVAGLTLKLAVVPAGRPLTLNVTGLGPPLSVRVTVYRASFGAQTATLDGATSIRKSARQVAGTEKPFVGAVLPLPPLTASVPSPNAAKLSHNRQTSSPP